MAWRVHCIAFMGLGWAWLGCCSRTVIVRPYCERECKGSEKLFLAYRASFTYLLTNAYLHTSRHAHPPMCAPRQPAAYSHTHTPTHARTHTYPHARAPPCPPLLLLLALAASLFALRVRRLSVLLLSSSRVSGRASSSSSSLCTRTRIHARVDTHTNTRIHGDKHAYTHRQIHVYTRT